MLKEEKNDMCRCSSSPPKASQFPYIRLEYPILDSVFVYIGTYFKINIQWEIISDN